jgi:hypothetical protein
VTGNISKEDVHRAVGQVMHPAISRSLVGMESLEIFRKGKQSLSAAYLLIPCRQDGQRA